jgi:L-iditol 2-dehydrogenase
MKAARLTGIREFEMTDVPRPQLRPGWAVVRLHSVGVCGSDVHYYTEGNIGSQVVEYPFIIGHECSGIVEEVGDGVTKLKPGSPVAIDPAISCGECYLCKMGHENVCTNLMFLGCPGQMEGSLKECLAMPAKNCYQIPDTMTFDEAVLTEPLAIAVHAVKLSRMQQGDNVAVLGSGPIGLLTMMTALHYGAEKAYATDIIPERVDFSRQMGAEQSFNYNTDDVVAAVMDRTAGRGVDIAFECAGEQETLDQAIDLLRPGGRLMIVGIPGAERLSFIADRARRHELLLQNVRRQNHNVEEAIQLVAEKRLDVARLATHHFPFDNVADAFDLVSSYSDGVIKAMIITGASA